jgi:predicted transporter
MGIIKILIAALLIWIGFKIYISLKSKTEKEKKDMLQRKIIPCSFCKTHIPISRAVKVNNKYFCSLDHSKNA